MSSKAVLITSVCLNAGLAVALVLSPKASSPTDTKEISTSSIVKSANARKNAAGDSPVIVTNVVDLGFHWREVESADYKEYIAKLRGIGCPEVTLREIILADIDKLFEPRLLALREPPNYQPEKFWLPNTGSTARKRDPEKVAQIKALTEERAALIKELLGVEESELREAMHAYEDPSKAAYAFLSPEQQSQMKELNKKFNEERSKIYENANGYIDGDTQAELNSLRKKMLAEMKAFMTPEQIFEYDIRTSDTARNMKYELQGFEPTEAEFRAMFAARRVQEDGRPMPGEKLTPEQMKANQEAYNQAQAVVKATMGEERYQEMQLAREYGYQQLVSAAPFLGFDKSAAQRVMSVKKESESAANDVRRNQSLTPEQRTLALQQIRMAAEAAVTKEIGEKGYKYYRNQGGYWFNNIAPRPAPAVTR